jgi:hypothetical protein
MNVEQFLQGPLMESYCLSDISPNRTHNRSNRSPGYRLCYVTEQYVPRLWLPERTRKSISTAAPYFSKINIIGGFRKCQSPPRTFSQIVSQIVSQIREQRTFFHKSARFVQ